MSKGRAREKRTSGRGAAQRKATGARPDGARGKRAVLPVASGRPTEDFLRWSFDWVDKDFDFVQNDKPESVVDFLYHLKSLEQIGTRKLLSDGKYYKSYPLKDIHKKAQERLGETMRDDLDSIERLRLGGKQRLYGSLRDSTFFVMWWDPEHRVCPSKKKHT